MSVEGREASYDQLAAQASLLAGIIQSSSRQPNIGMLLTSSPEAVAAFYAILWAGRVVVPLNVLLNPAELQKIVADAGLDLVLTTSELGKIAEQLPARIVCLDQACRPGAAASARSLPVPQAAPDDVAVILYTSGTTGLPRGVCLSQRNLHSNALDCGEHLRLTSADRFLGVLPLSHSFGLTATMVLPTIFGAFVEYHPRFVPADVLRVIADGGFSVFMATASMFGAMARVKNIAGDMLSGLRIAVSGGEALPHAVYRDYRERLGFTILEGYGLTETSPVVSANQPWANRAGTVGLPIPNVKVAIRDDEGRFLPPGQQGEICIHGPNVMRGYYNRPEDTAATILPDGWLRTGDLGTMDADGYTMISGRKKELIIVAGDNVLPREIETVLDAHPGVAESAVIGMPDAKRGEVVVGFVVPKEGMELTALELRNHCRQRLAGFKVPRQIIINRDLPRGPTGKIAKRLLVAPAALPKVPPLQQH